MHTKDIREVEVEEVEGLIKTPKRVSIKYFDMTREAGGVVLGYRFDTQFQIVRFVQLKSSAKGRDKYRLPSTLRVLWVLLLNMKFSEIMGGLTIIGEWHSDKGNHLVFSKGDMATIKKRVKRFGYWVCGVMIQHHRNIGKVKLKLFKLNNQTRFKNAPHNN